ncbi:MAG: intradiol ring-cleavage dioxygenase [Bacteroidota bacterium]
MTRYLGILLITLIALSCKSQSNIEPERKVGGPCEDCEALLDYELLNITPQSVDTLPGFQENEPKIKITGTVFQSDKTTPAQDVLLYVYHVDRTGRYTPGANPVGWERRHGQHRGWLITDKDGKFAFYTFRPVSYPEVQEPEHIHIYVKEANTVPYYIDSYLFESDPTLTEEEKQAEKNRGGSGIIRLRKENGIWTANRDIILGLNIPNYE